MNLKALAAWQASEGMALWANNPLATTDDAWGSKPYPPAPLVKMYPSLDVAATVYAAKFNSSLYKAIGNALRESESFQDIFTAINASPWCGGCQGGKYPIRLWQIVFGKVAPEPPPTEQKPEHEWNIPTEKTPASFKDLHRSWDQLTRAYGHTLPGALFRAKRHVKRYLKAVQ